MKPSENYFCDAELIENNNFVNGEHTFDNIACRSNEKSYRGKYSFKCTSVKKLACILRLDSLFAGDKLVVSVWANGDDLSKSGIRYHDEDNSIVFETKPPPIGNGDWSLIVDTFEIPDNVMPGHCSIYPFVRAKSETVYFDNFNVDVFKANKKVVPLDTFGVHFMPFSANLVIKKEHFEKLLNKREAALDYGLLFSSSGDLVNADFGVGKSSIPVKIRLKGDLMDHLKKNKWSFRIELDKGDSWRNMRHFSVHNSKARSHLSEWVMHRLFKKEGIITPQYDFFELSVNGDKWGIYAYEQHFDNNLLKTNQRPIAPILKHNDDGYWTNVKKDIKPFYWTDVSYIELFNKENAGDEAFINLYEVGKSMLHDFLNKKKTASEVFDIELLAKYFALLELSHALHAQHFTNIRFYINPANGRLEPIGFDCFGDHLPKVTFDWTAIGEAIPRRKNLLTKNNPANIYKEILFQDRLFFKAYMNYLARFCQPSYIESLRDELANDVEIREKYINKDPEYVDYKFSWEGLFNKASFTWKKIYPIESYSAIVYSNAYNRRDLTLESFHYFPMEIVATISKTDTTWLTTPIFVSGYSEDRVSETITLQTRQKTKEVIIRTFGTDSLFSVKALKQSSPKENINLIKMGGLQSLAELPYLKVYDRNIEFNTGEIIIKEILVIPPTVSQVLIQAGTHILFENQGSIISYSPITALGTPKQPIIFSAPDRGSYGLMIVNADQPSNFTNCVFNNLEGVRNRQYLSQGALSIYNSSLNITTCSFTNNNGESSLYLSNSQILGDQLSFASNYGNGIQLEYSKGHLNSLFISNIAKHGVFVSAGKVQIRAMQGENIGNTALKLDNNATCRIDKSDISNAEIAFSVYGGSKLKAYDVNWDIVEIGVKAIGQLDCKSEAIIYGKKMNSESFPYILDKYSSISINGKSQKRMK